MALVLHPKKVLILLDNSLKVFTCSEFLLHLPIDLNAELWFILIKELITESAEGGISSLSNLTSSGGKNQSLDQNPIRQVTDQAHEDALEKKVDHSREAELTRNVHEIGQNDEKKEIGSQHSQSNSKRASEKRVRLLSTAGISVG